MDFIDHDFCKFKHFLYNKLYKQSILAYSLWEKHHHFRNPKEGFMDNVSSFKHVVLVSFFNQYATWGMHFT